MGKISTLLQVTTQNTTTTHNNQHKPPPPYPSAVLALSLHGQVVGATNQWRRCFLSFGRGASKSTTQGGIFDLIMYITFDCAEIAAF
jgi:hypothetical protein